MPDHTGEMVALLREIRELLIPVADAYQDEYARRQSEREEQRLSEIRGMLSTEKRREAWELADGTKTQREIAKAVRIDEGGASKLFKALRELGAIEGENPKRTLEV